MADNEAACEDLVYFLQSVRGGPIKIGHTTRLQERMMQFQVGSFEQLVLLACTPGGVILERQLHSRFAKSRIRGEWFENTEELLGLIASIQSQTHKPSPVKKRPYEFSVSWGRHRLSNRLARSETRHAAMTSIVSAFKTADSLPQAALKLRVGVREILRLLVQYPDLDALITEARRSR